MSAVEPTRYIVSFHPKRIVHRFTDVLIIGSGLAGLRAALSIAPEFDVLIATKDAAFASNSSWAQGGIAAVWDPSDCFESHVSDTLAAGKGLCDHDVVDLVVREAPERIRELIRWGTVFDEKNGMIDLGREGGHSFSRILHALGDATGREVIRAVLEQVKARPSVDLCENTFLLDLLTEEGRCRGALLWSQSLGPYAVWAEEVILATGGCGQLFRETTNPALATGDGIAAAYRAGGRLQDMEFVQFHPTVLYVAGSARSLISEAVRGEGAFLRDATGHRFMPDYDPKAELAPRDTVAKAIVTQMALTNHPCVYLDQRHLDADKVRSRFPSITSACRKYGLDFATDLIPVRPGAHYMIGGVRTDTDGKSSIPGLWACGEVSANGLHGANRLASNSLLEALVFGHRSGLGASASIAGRKRTPIVPSLSNAPQVVEAAELDLADIRNSLQSLMFRQVGIERDKGNLEGAIASIDFWCKYVLGREFKTPIGWELQNMLLVGGIMARAAHERTESRGTHNRSDFPRRDDDRWRVHLVTRQNPFGFERTPVRDKDR